MKDEYDPSTVEAKWRERWEREGAFRFQRDITRRKFYVLEMFPYTSGRLHIGHARNYTMGDVVARMQRARGLDVLYPMGWDAFGLPAENAAISHGIHPREFTRSAVSSMKAAMKLLGLSYDWNCEINTSAPAYIKGQQELFLELFERGLVYRDTRFVHWCGRCATVLASEQAAGGACWRCREQVSKRRVPQWFLDIRHYADELLDGLDRLSGWPDSVKNIQRAWIGRSDGTEILFELEDSSEPLRVFTTRVDTLFGCTFLALAAEHSLLDTPHGDAAQAERVAGFRQRVLLATFEERVGARKEGVFTGRHAIHPFSGERLPVWAASYVLAEYGMGAVMGVPAHDQRDFEFALEHGLPIRHVVRSDKGGESPSGQAWVDDGVLVGSGEFDGLRSAEARRAIVSTLERQGRGSAKREYRLQNWSVSRQRYWGCPIPIVHCGQCGAVAARREDLPLLLPDVINFRGTGSPLAQVPDFIDTECPQCGRPAQRDSDTMDTFVDSSWYFLRFPTPESETPFDSEVVNRMLPVDLYIGGVEHASLHLMYARFFVKVLRDFGRLSFDEPFVRLYNHGMVNDAVGRKQSKSVGNVVDPTEVIKTYGADALRLYLMFTTAYNAPINWSDTGPKDARAYLARVWRLGQKLSAALAVHSGSLPDRRLCAAGAEHTLRMAVHAAIRAVTADIEAFQFNTAIAALMTLANEISTYPPASHVQPAAAAYRTLLRLLAPFAPHFCEEAWSNVGGHSLLVFEPWLEVEEDAFVTEEKKIAIQVNGRLVTTITLPAQADGDQILRMALAHPSVESRLAGKEVARAIHVPGRLVNIVSG